MPLDREAQKLVDAFAALNLKPVEESTVEEARESIRSRTAALGPFEDVASVTETPSRVATTLARLITGPTPASTPQLTRQATSSGASFRMGITPSSSMTAWVA